MLNDSMFAGTQQKSREFSFHSVAVVLIISLQQQLEHIVDSYDLVLLHSSLGKMHGCVKGGQKEFVCPSGSYCCSVIVC